MVGLFYFNVQLITVYNLVNLLNFISSLQKVGLLTYWNFLVVFLSI